MGLNICIENDQEGQVSNDEWDWMRHEGDKKVLKILYQAEVERERYSYDEPLAYLRPVDVDAFEKRLLEQIEVNHNRWKQMCALLRKPDNWLYFSY